MRALENHFGVAAGSWNSAGNDGVLEVFTQSHPRVPEECEAPVRWEAFFWGWASIVCRVIWGNSAKAMTVGERAMLSPIGNYTGGERPGCYSEGRDGVR